ncbi:MAG TPA: TrkA family potassium uptake protein [Victivallales bacterium]|nr:TrkA family potassium uptake protein [Victivallales bacterium]
MSDRKTGVVIGLGEFGSHIATTLSSEGCEVIAIDISEKRINNIKDFVMQAVVADASQVKSIEQVIPTDIDFIVLAIGNIEKSMIATLYLKDYGFNKLYVKAVTDEHEKILKLLGVEHIIFPERDIAKRIATRLVSSNLLDYLPLSDDYSIAEVKPLDKMQGVNLKDLAFRRKYNLSIIAVKRLDARKLIFTPGPFYVIAKGDILTVLGKKQNIETYNDLIKEK